MFDIISDVMNPQTRKNISQISKMFCTVVSHKVFNGAEGDGTELFLEPLNEYIVKATNQMDIWFNEGHFLPLLNRIRP